MITAVLFSRRRRRSVTGVFPTNSVLVAKRVCIVQQLTIITYSEIMANEVV